jgi:hypothetical protein
MTRHAHADALTESDFESLLDGAKQLHSPWKLEAMTAALIRR